MKKEILPKHVAIIMDGNGRWAIKKGFSRNRGHRAGAENLITITRHVNSIGIEALTVFAFSTENWNRPKKEVEYLMKLPVDFFKSNLKRFKKDNIKIGFIGTTDKLPQEVLNIMAQVKEETALNTGLHLTVAFNYGAKDELIRSINKLIDAGIRKVDENTFDSFLDTANLPEVDLLIRTSGEHRISNFLLWQLAYSELYFTEVLWPDFNIKEFDKAIEEYQSRQRRYGGLK